MKRSFVAASMAAVTACALRGHIRSGILAISNGVISRASPDRQGMQSALVNDLSPLNVLQHAPDPSQRDSAYSPLWDLRLVRWTAAAIASNQREKVFCWGAPAGPPDR